MNDGERAISTRRKFEDSLGGPMFAAETDAELEEIARQWDDHLAAEFAAVRAEEREACEKACQNRLRDIMEGRSEVVIRADLCIESAAANGIRVGLCEAIAAIRARGKA